MPLLSKKYLDVDELEANYWVEEEGYGILFVDQKAKLELSKRIIVSNKLRCFINRCLLIGFGIHKIPKYQFDHITKMVLMTEHTYNCEFNTDYA